MVEGIIVLPVFVLLLAAMMYFGHAYRAKLDASVQARSCAWAYSLAGCVGKADLPEGCEVERIGDGDDAFESIEDNHQMGSESLAAFGRKGANGSPVDGALAGASSIGRALTGLREGVRSTPTRSVVIPSILGGGTRSVSANYSVMCNEREYSPSSLAIEAYCALSTSMPGCQGDSLQ